MLSCDLTWINHNLLQCHQWHSPVSWTVQCSSCTLLDENLAVGPLFERIWVFSYDVCGSERHLFPAIYGHKSISVQIIYLRDVLLIMGNVAKFSRKFLQDTQSKMGSLQIHIWTSADNWPYTDSWVCMRRTTWARGTFRADRHPCPNQLLKYCRTIWLHG